MAEPEGKGGAAQGASLNAQGRKLLDENRPGEAVPVLARSVAAFPADTQELDYAFALFNYGRALRLAGRPDDAVTVLQRRLKINNQRPTVQAELDKARAAAQSR